MNRFNKFLASILLLLLLGVASAETKKRPDPSFINHYNKAVALMYAGKTLDKLEFHCTATAFERTATGFLFISAGHCVQGKPDGVDLYMGDDVPDGKRYIASVLAEGDQSKLYDFSVLYAAAPPDAFAVMPLGVNPKQLGEPIFAISSPYGIGREYMEGVVTILDIQSKSIVDEDGTIWQHNIGFQVLGEGPGSSGSSIVCEDQDKVCLIIVGHLDGVMVAEPIERFKQWWADVQAGKIPHAPLVLLKAGDTVKGTTHERPHME